MVTRPTTTLHFTSKTGVVRTELTRTAGAPVLVVNVDYSERFLDECRSPLRRYLMRKSYELGCGVSSILENSIPGSIEPVKSAIDSFLRP